MKNLAKATTITLAVGGLTAMGAGAAFAEAEADGAAVDSPGVISGNLVQVPVHVPVNVCGNSGNLIAALNPAFGNVCVNAS